MAKPAYNIHRGDTMDNVSSDNCYKINITWDNEADVWIAISDDIPLALESDSFDALINKIKIIAPEILALNSKNYTPTSLLIKSERLIING